MKNSNYVSVIAVLLCFGMTGPLWLDRLGLTENTSLAEPFGEVSADELGELTKRPAPAMTPEPAGPDNSSTADTRFGDDTRLACGLGIISRLRNRGDRCVAVPQYAQPYTSPQPVYTSPQQFAPQPCVPQQYVPTAPPCIPQQCVPIVSQPMVTQPYVQQPPQQPRPPQPAAPLSGGPCNCQSCCKEFTLTRWRVVPEEQEVEEDYIDTELSTSRFCDSSCESGDCVETIGIQNTKRHVVKQQKRRYTVTKLVRETVVEKRCVECGCIRDTQLTAPAPSYNLQKPVLEETTDTPDLKNATFELFETPAPLNLRQSKRLEWQSPQQTK